MPTPSAQVRPITLDPGATLQHAWDLWLDLPQPTQEAPNAARNPNDLGGYRRALELFAVGVKGAKGLAKVPISEFAVEIEVARQRLAQGAEIDAARRRRAPSSEKTLKNLKGYLSRIHEDLSELLSLPTFKPPTGNKLRKAKPRRPRRKRLPREEWPQSLQQDWLAYKQYRTDPYYVGPGREHRGAPVRVRSLNGYKGRIGQLVRFIVEQEPLPHPTLLDLADPDRIARFRAWYFEQDPEGGHTGFQHTCIELAQICKYLCAVGRAYSEFTPDSTEKAAPWTKYYTLGQETREIGARQGVLVKRTIVDDMTPADLIALGELAWTTPPRKRSNSGTTLGMRFNRKRDAMFFLLGPFMPIRRRNWIEMQWGKNLYQNRHGRWTVRFAGEELKIGHRNGEINVYTHELPDAACNWIVRWRQYLTEIIGENFEEQCPYVLPCMKKSRNTDGSLAWGMCLFAALSTSVGNTCLELRGHDFPLHQIRHIVATYLVNRSQSLADAQVAADLLGDTLETVLATYYRPDRANLRNAYFDALQSTVKAA